MRDTQPPATREHWGAASAEREGGPAGKPSFSRKSRAAGLGNREMEAASPGEGGRERKTGGGRRPKGVGPAGQGPGLEPQGRARPVGEEKQMTQELTGHIASVQAEEAGLRREKARLHSETQQLRQRLQMLPGVHVDHLTQLQEKWCKEEASCSELERKLAAPRGQTTSTQQIRGVYQEVAEAQGQHWRKTVPTSRRRSSLWRREPRRAGWGPRGWRESPRSSGKTTSATGRRCRSRVTPSPSDGALVLC
nr:uncharacterized protein LOC105104395 [Camelus dromedarius]